MIAMNGEQEKQTSTQVNGVQSAECQYADGKGPSMWEEFKRTDECREFFVNLLREKGCKTVLDVACGTGIDSVLFIEEGFQVTSIDVSEEMLKYALEIRWDRRKEKGFDDWVIRQANWLTLIDDLKDMGEKYFDAVVCLGNSFPHLEDPDGDKKDMRVALKNIQHFVKPGGLLLIDHRNYDQILDTGCTPPKFPYYTAQNMKKIRTHVTYVDGEPNLVTLNYMIDLGTKYGKHPQNGVEDEERPLSYFQLSYYPHRLESFRKMLLEACGKNCKHSVFGDFKPLNKITKPVFYIHAVEKPY